ncbi:hypothetical protein L6164_034939 [Bauhinia variegata]|uniref:Uncharacterized protein n=1 Tax=Bauhinia variegata TaxID=167791 RepID=A0ACB9KX29_BAUVA|nr:hypothetical protein L6164_034939 [Bauhinia variegata]
MSPKPSPDLPFKPGSAVEINPADEGFGGSWYEGTVIRRCSSKNNASQFLVEYKTIMETQDTSKPLQEKVDAALLRPVPPKDTNREFKFGEVVDAYFNEGWWEGAITQDLGNGRFTVYFRGTKEQIEFGKEDLRLHREWVNGNWVPPIEEQKAPATEVKSNEAFRSGTLVEVSSDEDGLQGAWFAATIVEARGNDKFLIQYQSLRTEDDSEFLKEEIDVLQIRPRPPETQIPDRFNVLEEVDALYNDGWWVGVIAEVLEDSSYIVYFRNNDEEMKFQHSELRLHQEWIDNKWIMASEALKL